MSKMIKEKRVKSLSLKEFQVFPLKRGLAISDGMHLLM